VEPWKVPIADYDEIPGVVRAARVGDYPAWIDLVGFLETVPELRLLAVDWSDLPDVAYYRRDFSQASFGELMSGLRANENGLLLPTELLRKLQLDQDARLVVRVRLEEKDYRLGFRVAGSFDYFPTMYPEQAMVVVANMDYLEAELGRGFPFTVWMRVTPGADPRRILHDVRQMGIYVTAIQDLRGRLSGDQQTLERTGIFGVLSICFLAGALLAGLGLMIHSAFDLYSRAVDLAVLQALGMGRRDVIAGVGLEHGLIIAYGLLGGTAAGMLAAHLYVPFFPLIGTSQSPVPDFLPLLDWRTALWMVVALTLGLVVLEVGLALRYVRADTFRSLRLGVRP
jgi:putative ABC transport system permease protein